MTKIEPIQAVLIEALRDAKDLDAFVAILNESKSRLYGDRSAKRLQKKNIAFYANHQISKNKYKVFSINKKSGAQRTIHSPYKGLKTIQRSINYILNESFKFHPNSFGFIPSRSIVDGAKLHVNRKYVYNIDLKDFFPSVSSKRVFSVLQLEPFNLSADIASKIANICTTELKVERLNSSGSWESKIERVLPQGAPTSPTLTNIICQRLDRRLSGLAKRFGLRYSRYADDISFSSDHYVYKKNGEFVTELNRLILGEGFHVKTSKTRLQKHTVRQEVTGVTVNRKCNVSNQYIKSLRTMIHNWEKTGYDYAENIMHQNYGEVKTKMKKLPTLQNVISGKLLYLKMVKGETDPTLSKLLHRFTLLLQGSESAHQKTIHNSNIDEIISSTLAIMKKQGLKKAIDFYGRKIKE